MQCFICVTYMFFITTVHPKAIHEPNQVEKRSLFHDVIESLRIHAQLPEEYQENKLANFNKQLIKDKYDDEELEEEVEHENQELLPSDGQFIPRRNDRLEILPLKHRFPKMLNETIDDTEPKKEIVVFIDTTSEPKTTTPKPKKQRRTRPPFNKSKTQKDEEDIGQKPEENKPLTNHMAGQSHIGNRESQMVVKPTVIVNLRGSVNYRDGEIKIEGRNTNQTYPLPGPQNVFNINQEIKLERTFPGMGSNGGTRQEIKDERVKEKQKDEEDMMMCETATWSPEKNREGRKYTNVLQILFTL